jgi:hypothetical protein
MKTERLQSAQLDGFDASTLRIIQEKPTPAVNLNPRCTFYLHQAIRSQHEFHYQIQVVHYSAPPVYIKRDSNLKLDSISVFSSFGHRNNRHFKKSVQ